MRPASPRSGSLSRSTINFCPEDAELLTHGPSHVLAPAAESALLVLALPCSSIDASATERRHASSCGGRGAGRGLIGLFGENPRKNPHAQAKSAQALRLLGSLARPATPVCQKDLLKLYLHASARRSGGLGSRSYPHPPQVPGCPLSPRVGCHHHNEGGPCCMAHHVPRLRRHA